MLIPTGTELSKNKMLFTCKQIYAMLLSVQYKEQYIALILYYYNTIIILLIITTIAGMLLSRLTHGLGTHELEIFDP